MTTTATETLHQPWCNDHADADHTQPGDTGACSWQRRIGGDHFVNVEQGENGSQQPYVAVWGNGEGLTLQEAREMAAAIIEASVFAAGRTEASARVAANLTRIVAERQPMDVNVVEHLAGLLDVSVVDLFTD